jgi:predicted RecA/RadA family phage recombinase
MKNYIKKGNSINVTAGADISSGDVVQVGAFIGVASVDIANGSTGEVALEGVFELPKKEALAINQGDKVYWDSTPGEVTKTQGDGVFLGHAETSVGGAASTVRVKLEGGLLGQAATQANSAAADVAALVTDFNALLAKLKAAGLMASA